MCIPRRSIFVGAVVLFFAGSLRAQSAASLTGHWEGSVQLPAMEVPFEVDLATNANGELAGTFGQPAQRLRGLPLSNVTRDGGTVTFMLVSGSTFRGTVDADGQSMNGELASAMFGTIPVTLTRTGDAHIEAPLRNAAIGKEMEGVWNGTIELDSGYRVVLKMANQPDGTSAGTMASLDEHGLELPVGITQKGSTLTLDVRALGASYTGVMNAAGTEMTGTYKTAQGAEVPLTLHRAPATDSKK
jgi:hypothetical protein